MIYHLIKELESLGLIKPVKKIKLEDFNVNLPMPECKEPKKDK